MPVDSSSARTTRLLGLSIALGCAVIALHGIVDNGHPAAKASQAARASTDRALPVRTHRSVATRTGEINEAADAAYVAGEALLTATLGMEVQAVAAVEAAGGRVLDTTGYGHLLRLTAAPGMSHPLILRRHRPAA